MSLYLSEQQADDTPTPEKKGKTSTAEWTGVTFKDGTYRAYITGEISDEEKWYYPLLEALYNATDKDTVHILINSGGGHVDASNAIMSAIYSCKAKIRIEVTGGCASAAAQIFFFTVKIPNTEYYISMLSRILIHPFTGGAYQRFDALQERVEGMLEWQARHLRTIYEGILTDEEIQSILKGKEFYLKPEDAISRINSYLCELDKEEAVQHHVEDKHRKDLEDLTAEALAFYLEEKKKKTKPKTNVTRKAKEPKPAAPAPVK